MKNIQLEIVKVTEDAAIAASQYVGLGDKLGADKAATDAMRNRLNKINFRGRIVLGEGIKDGSYGLFSGEWVGEKSQNVDLDIIPPSELKNLHWLDICVDPIEGTTPTAYGGPEAIAVLAISEKSSLLEIENFYMKKLAVGPKISNKVNLDVNKPVTDTMNDIANALNKPINSLTACLLNRPRHGAMITELRKLGCRIKLIQDCDVTAAVATCMPHSGIDILLGIGGSPEGVIAASALKCMGGEFQGLMVEKDGSLIEDKIYSINDLVKKEVIFCATGITDGSLLKGVGYGDGGQAMTHSIFMKSESNTIRKISTSHGN